MSGKKKKETRIMKVTMDADEFAKFDKGETHSNKGVRNNKGKLSALPDIAPVSERDLPRRQVVKTQKIYVEKKPSVMQELGREIGYTVLDVTTDALRDPYVRRALWHKAKRFWRYKIKPLFAPQEEPKKDSRQITTQLSKQRQQADVEYQVETVNGNNERIIVTGEQAELMINAMRKKARELASMIYLLSNIVVKDEKTNEECVLEESFIKQLVSDEATRTMRTLIAHRQLLDENTAICFDDWLNGYIRNDGRRIPVPIMIEGKSPTIASEQEMTD